MSQQVWPSHWPTNWELMKYLFYNMQGGDTLIRQLWVNANPQERELARSLFYIPDDVKNMDLSAAMQLHSPVEDLDFPN